MKPYSLDLRQRILDAYDRGDGTVRELAVVFGVCPNTVQNYLSRRRRTGDVTPSPHGGGVARVVRPQDERVLRALVERENDRTDAEYARKLAEKTGRKVSRRTINRTWERLGYTRKKKALHASEQDRPDVQQARRRFRRQARKHRKRRFIFIDEFGTNLGMTRRMGRALRGRRAIGAVPVNTDPNVTLTIGLTRRGLLAPFAFEHATNGPSFEAYVRTQLAPKLKPGDIVVADGLGAHRTRGARAVIESRGADFWLLPPYSPDLTPVEEAGAKIKEAIRSADARSVPALYAAMATAIGSITERDAHGWFDHRADYLRACTRPVRPPL